MHSFDELLEQFVSGKIAAGDFCDNFSRMFNKNDEDYSRMSVGELTEQYRLCEFSICVDLFEPDARKLDAARAEGYRYLLGPEDLRRSAEGFMEFMKKEPLVLSEETISFLRGPNSAPSWLTDQVGCAEEDSQKPDSLDQNEQ